jgi:uncharacterized protein (UPF0332 family)
VPPAPPADAVKKDMQEAFNDISYAKKSLSDDNYKWAIAQAYYSMYLSARAALFSKGYSIKKVNSHLCLAHFISRLVELKQLKSIFRVTNIILNEMLGVVVMFIVLEKLNKKSF